MFAPSGANTVAPTGTKHNLACANDECNLDTVKLLYAESANLAVLRLAERQDELAVRGAEYREAVMLVEGDGDVVLCVNDECADRDFRAPRALNRIPQQRTAELHALKVPIDG